MENINMATSMRANMNMSTVTITNIITEKAISIPTEEKRQLLQLFKLPQLPQLPQLHQLHKLPLPPLMLPQPLLTQPQPPQPPLPHENDHIQNT
jgi:hypothetical protein